MACTLSLQATDQTRNDVRARERFVDPPGSRKRQVKLVHHEKRAAHQGALLRVLTGIALMLSLLAPASAAEEQNGVLGRGDAIVTGFSGIKPTNAPTPPGGNPLDEFFIDPEGASAQIQALSAFGQPPQGQLIAAPSKFQVKARQVGQVFAIALDDGFGAQVPNIYLGATSAYGLQIVLSDADDDGAPERIKTGQPGAGWMAGQFGKDLTGGPGSIYKVDGQTGAASLFTTLPDNSGPGVGDIVFDKSGRQFFASDLDGGLIYRLGDSGEVIDSFDHGRDGRPAKGLTPVTDNGKQAEIGSAAFNSEDPESWGYTQEDRRVHGLAVHDGRLYYAVADQVWSIGIYEGFDKDARWELNVEGLPGKGPITDMLFDKQGRLYLAQRGHQRGSYDYSLFAEPQKSAVVRYRREEPDNSATESVWVAESESHAIGLPAEHNHAEGGIALGYSHDETGALRYGACGEMLWSTGHRLRNSAIEPGGEEEGQADVHGLQGNAASLVRPQNVPPQQSYFADYDSFFGDAAKAGHTGDVEIWQPCEGAPDFASVQTYGELPPGIFPPGNVPPDFPPEFPPDYEFHANLKLDKRATPKSCWSAFGGWLCKYTVRVTNTGPDNYFGPIVVRDWLPATPAGAAMGFNWTCATLGASDYRCWKLGVFLAPGWSTDLTAYAWVPKAYPKCHLTNGARIEWAPPGSNWNSDPTDDIDFAAATIPSKDCDPNGKKKTDLKIYKEAVLDCFEWNGGIRCGYKIRVENQGPGPYNGDIVVQDTIPNGATAIFSGGGWAPCPNTAPVYTCTTNPAANLPNPGDAVTLTVRVDLPIALAKQLGCKVKNQAAIIQAPGGSDQNTDPSNDMASAIANVPAKICNGTPGGSNLKIEKTGPRTALLSGACKGSFDWCEGFHITVTNTGPNKFQGHITVTDIPPPGVTIQHIGSAFWNCNNLTCTTKNAVTLDKNPPSSDNASFTVIMSGTAADAKAMNCKLTNKAKIDMPLGAPSNTIAADDMDQVTIDLPSKFCTVPKTNLKLEKRVSAIGCLEKDNYDCFFDITVTNVGPGDYNDKIVVNEFIPLGTTVVGNWNCINGQCTHGTVLLKPGEKVVLGVTVSVPRSLAKELKCKVTNGAKIVYAPGGSNSNTDLSDDIDMATASLPAKVCQESSTLSSPQCPPGFSWNGDRCGRPDPSCPQGWTAMPVKGKCCPPGRPWNAREGQCGDDDDDTPSPGCEAGWTPIPGMTRCCPPGKPWTGQQCGRDAPAPECPDGTTGQPPRCKPIVERCPKGLVGTPPDCERPKCPAGMTGRPPHCKVIAKTCPKGQVGTPPNCRKITVDKPKKCPPGTVGRYPKCRPIVRACPPGRVGKPPNCRRIELMPEGLGDFRPRLRLPQRDNPIRIMPRPGGGGGRGQLR